MTLGYLRPDSRETPYQAVRGVMRLAVQLKVKGYKKYRSIDYEHEMSEDNDEDDHKYDNDDASDDDEFSSMSNSDSESDGDSYRRSARKNKA